MTSRCSCDTIEVKLLSHNINNGSRDKDDRSWQFVLQPNYRYLVTRLGVTTPVPNLLLYTQLMAHLLDKCAFHDVILSMGNSTDTRKVWLKLSGGWVEALREYCADVNFKVDLKLDVNGTGEAIHEVAVVLEAHSEQFLKGEIEDSILNNWMEGTTGGDATVSVIVDQESVHKGGKLAVLDPLKICKTIFDERSLTSDITIVTQSGNEIPCHKSFLMAHSAVWKARFQSNFADAKTSAVIMDDMEDDEVNALLKYLYSWDLKGAEGSCRVASRLLFASQKYMIDTLQTEVKAIILQKPVSWFELAPLFELYTVAQGINGTGDPELVRKLLDVMKARRNELKGSDALHELFAKAPKIAMELFIEAIKN